jgi:hypothetical protein
MSSAKFEKLKTQLKMKMGRAAAAPPKLSAANFPPFGE